MLDQLVMGEPVGMACPGCGQPPQLIVGDEQAFCGNDDCHVFAWNPTKTLGELSEDVNEIPMDNLRRMFLGDQEEWPDGHPCRDCDRLAKDHSIHDSNCAGWR